MLRARVSLALALALGACGGPAGGAGQASAPPVAAVNASYVVDTVATGIAFPWSLAVLPDGAMLVTSKEGALRRISAAGQLEAQPIAGVPPVLYDGQGGLLEVSAHPRFSENQLIYLSYSAGTPRANHTELARARLEGAALKDLQVIFRASPDKDTVNHFGGRILWLPDETLLLTLGDGFVYREKAQSLDADFGKIVRLKDDGAIPPDNPFVGKQGARGEIFSYGHRNVQGIARDPVSGAIYANEHGPRGGDEINLLAAGKNYGWPVITYGRDYSGAVISPFTERPGLEQPLLHWTPSIAPAGLMFYSGDLFPAWKGSLFTAALAGQEVRRVWLEGAKVAGQESHFAELGQRFRDVRQGPDGSIYLLTDSPDGQVLRVRPK